jgi:hypothetical protein
MREISASHTIPMARLQWPLYMTSPRPHPCRVADMPSAIAKACNDPGAQCFRRGAGQGVQLLAEPEAKIL